jgi:hypothetical protein
MNRKEVLFQREIQKLAPVSPFTGSVQAIEVKKDPATGAYQCSFTIGNSSGEQVTFDTTESRIQSLVEIAVTLGQDVTVVFDANGLSSVLLNVS